MKLGIVGAILGGLAGALVWALIARFLNIELGYVAWGVGFAVGFTSALLGGSGIGNGISCAVICLISIFAGKVLAAHWSLTPDIIGGELKKMPEFSSASPAEVDAAVKVMQANWGWAESIEAAKSDLGPMDLLFAGLGVVTAFQLGRQSGNQNSAAPSYEPGSYNPIPEPVKPDSEVPPAPESNSEGPPKV